MPGMLTAGAQTTGSSAGGAQGQATVTTAASESKTQVVILGTGTPRANPDASGPAVAIVVNGAVYLVDCGPGVVRRAAAAQRKGHKVMQFLDAGRYVGVEVDGKVTMYGKKSRR